MARQPRNGIPRAVGRAVRERSGGLCEACRQPSGLHPSYGSDLRFHHVVPASRGGPETIENLRLLCGACHCAADEALGVRGRPKGDGAKPPGEKFIGVGFRLRPKTVDALRQIPQGERAEFVRQAVERALDEREGME